MAEKNPLKVIFVAGTVASETVDVDDSLGKGLRGFLRGNCAQRRP